MTQVSHSATAQQKNPAVLIGRILLSLGIAILIFLGLRWAVAFMKDKEAPEQLLLTLYARLGLDQAAVILTENGLNPFAAKLMIMAVALLVGVAGVWILFWAANDLIGH
ncbi:MAG: hypothetical protein GY796_35850, partial [Chloroflexi bacterium]|nr:hypothetical protein [Chloroflexota bacterium]